MRKLHRWVTAVAMVFLLYVSITGLLLALDFVTAPEMGPPPGAGADAAPASAERPAGFATPGSSAAFPLASAAGWAVAALAVAQPALDGQAITQFEMQLQLVDGQPQALVTAGGMVLAIDVATGDLLKRETRPDRPARRGPDAGADGGYVAMRQRLHELLQDIHRGSIVGVPGQVIDVLTGISLSILAISGIAMYVQMLAKRRSSGRQQLFWK